MAAQSPNRRFVLKLCLAGLLVVMGLAGVAVVRRRTPATIDAARSPSGPAAEHRRPSAWSVPRLRTGTPGAPVPDDPASSTRGLVVRVEDVLGGPIEGAEVAVGGKKAAVTDATGIARVAAGAVPPSGKLRVSAAGYAPDQSSYTLPGEAVVWLLPGSRLGGVVVATGTGTPIGGLLVTANEHEVISDREGRFLFRDLPAESYRLQARGEQQFGMLPHPVAIGPGRAVAGIRLEVKSAFRIQGRVRARGQPLPEALMVEGAGSTSPIDGEGRYQLLGVVPGRYDVRVKHEGQTFFALSASARVRVIDRDVVQDLELGERFELEVQTVTSRGVPVAALQVSATHEDKHGLMSVACTTDVTGSCRIGGCQRGPLVIEVDGTPNRKVTVPAPGRIRLVVDASAQLSGRLVTPSGRPPGPRGVWLEDQRSADRQSLWSEQDGRFWFRPVLPGRFRLNVTEERGLLSPEYPVEATTEVELADGEVRSDLVLTLANEDGQISGRVLNQTGAPVADVLVSGDIFHRNFIDNRAVLGRPVVTGADGRFLLRDLARPYRYRVLAYRSSGERAEALDVVPGGPPVILSLQPLSTLTVLVQDEQGENESASVTIYDDDQVLGWGGREDGGTVRFDSLLPGRRRVEATLGRLRAEAVVDLEPGAAQTVRLTLR